MPPPERHTHNSSHGSRPTLGCVVAEFTMATLPSSSVARRMCVTKSRGRHGQTPIVALQEILLSLSITSTSLPSSTRGLYCRREGMPRGWRGRGATNNLVKREGATYNLNPMLSVVLT